MATKAKTAPTAAADATLEARLSAAIESFQAGKPQPKETLEALALEAAAEGNVVMARRVRTMMAALQAQADRAKADDGDLMATAVSMVNRKQGQDALILLERATKEMEAAATYHYVRAQAFCQIAQPDAAAEALGKAIAINPDLVFAYRLEPEFDGVRRHPAFVTFETE